MKKTIMTLFAAMTLMLSSCMTTGFGTAGTTLHVATGTAFFVKYCGNLVDEILKGEWAPREETIGGYFWKERK